MRSLARDILSLAAVVALGCALTSCASSQRATGDTKITQTDAGSVVEIQLDEYKIHMPTEIPAGHTTFQISNMGDHDHNIRFKGPEEAEESKRIDVGLPENLEPGKAANLVVDLEPGKYDVSCPVTGHKTLGMRLDLTVTSH